MNTDAAVRRLTEVVRRQHLALATERTCRAWLTRSCDFLKGLPLHLPSEHKIERFLTVHARKNVAASTQNQAVNAIIFGKQAPGACLCPAAFALRCNLLICSGLSLFGGKFDPLILRKTASSA